MASLVQGQLGDWSHESARQKALAAAAQRSGQHQGYIGDQMKPQVEFNWAQQANDTGIRASTIMQESAINAGNNSIVNQINQAIEQQQAQAQAALDAQAATLNSMGGEEAPESPRLSAYLRALRKSNNMDVNDRTLDGQLGTYGMSADVLRNKQGGEEGGWDQQALGRDISTEEFLNSRKLQTQIARYKFGKYLKKSENEAGALTKWHQKTTPTSDEDTLASFLAQFVKQFGG